MEEVNVMAKGIQFHCLPNKDSALTQEHMKAFNKCIFPFLVFSLL